MECNINNNIPVRISNFSYILLNRSVLYNCQIEAENHFLFESLAACQESESVTFELYSKVGFFQLLS